MDTARTHREIISRLLSESTSDIQHVKLEVCRQGGLERIPKNSELLGAAYPEERELLRRRLMLKPTRTASGVAPVAVMTSPHPCPHGRCLPCPGGPDHPFHSPQSYTGEEPAALRGREHDYDPFAQVTARLAQFDALGHHVNKVELIVMGGTITARPREFQEFFVRRCLDAMNNFPGDAAGLSGSFGEAALKNEGAKTRCVAITFETRPDWCRREHIESMLELGVTKVELGVQHLDDRILEMNRRGCNSKDTIVANTLLRDAGLKVGFHIMPNLYGSTIEQDRKMFQKLFEDSNLRPDFLKIYPTLVTPGSELEHLWRKGEYTPYPEDELLDLLAHAKAMLPEYVRLQRIQRDIPARLILAGSHHGNIRQLARNRLEASGGRCRCIRCREVGRNPETGGDIEFRILSYACCEGEEYFISACAGERLIGFARLRFPSQPFLPELENTTLLRELHVYGEMVPVGSRPDEFAWQHRHIGSELIGIAERRAEDQGFRSLAVMSGVGVRPYYRRQGYVRAGPYMRKDLG
ncbi:MAG: tRNA uridine(34) 5-carboxymethylaminomethyl modification radical SAM/GNAT enzyme Elp3 [Methanomicrobiales archaeon]|nr:tRNA uridine(34) 5-carboxymethylaminomethyl modification radical SAM/GNAT enzyme Elp3 [Methanomicrobiales archaeon]